MIWMQSMVRIILIRPGSCDFDEQRRIQGTLDVPLNERGDAEVARQIEELRSHDIEALYYSDCQTARETAETIAEALAVKLKKLDNMHNLDHGLWQGMRIDELRHKHPRLYKLWQESPESVCPPSGETVQAAQQRVQAVLKRLIRKHKRGTIGLIVPEPLGRLVRSHLSHTELGDLWEATQDHGRWEVIDVEPQVVN